MTELTNIRLHVYLAWVNAWLSTPKNSHGQSTTPMSLEDMGRLFQDENILQLLNGTTMSTVVTSFQHHLNSNKINLGGTTPPSCDETNILSEKYNPQTECSCSGLYPVPSGLNLDQALAQSNCGAIRNMLQAADTVNKREKEWNNGVIFTKEKLHDAMLELVLANSDTQPPPSTCSTTDTTHLKIKAPDRRPNPKIDTELSVYHQFYPTNEQIKLCADAKYFFAMACGAGVVDEGLLRAIADSGNDILIGDYCEAADEKTLRLLQRVGGASMAFLKLHNLAGVITDWQFDNHVGSTIQFRVLGYYRDHARERIEEGLYGSRMSGMNVHRHIDVAIYIGVMAASLATEEKITEREYMELAEVCSLINDLVDFRSDTMRKQRENTVLRGIRGSLCEYLDGLISSCLAKVTEAVSTSQLHARVVMSFCNWAVMACHHKLYELVHEVSNPPLNSMCTYTSSSGDAYAHLLQSLSIYGSLGENGPRVTRKRAEMDTLYQLHRTSEAAHLAWLADSTRSLLDPVILRRIVDVVHFEWRGEMGDVGYCP